MEFASTPREQSEHQARREAGGNEAMSSPDGEPGRQSMLRSLRQLLRHRYFRRLLAVRVAVQSSDGVLQVALAAYVLFSPERQPDATSIAIVLAITLLPFSILGPFAAIVIDRVSRRQVLVVANLARAAVALGLAVLIATGLQTVGVEVLIYGGLLLAMSLNRFLLAALSASLPHTIDPHEYMVANSVVPTVGPAGLLIGVALATPLRLILGHVMTDYQANAILFLIATVGFVLSAVLALSIPRRQLGPDDRRDHEGARRGHRSRRGRRASACAAPRRYRAAHHRRTSAHPRHRHRRDDLGVPKLLSPSRRDRSRDRRSGPARRHHGGRLRFRVSCGTTAERATRAAQHHDHVPAGLGGFPAHAGCDLRSG